MRIWVAMAVLFLFGCAVVGPVWSLAAVVFCIFGSAIKSGGFK